jgi:hypothetical protein
MPGYGGYAAIPEGDPQGSGLSGLPSVPYMLELIRADDIEVGGLAKGQAKAMIFGS